MAYSEKRRINYFYKIWKPILDQCPVRIPEGAQLACMIYNEDRPVSHRIRWQLRDFDDTHFQMGKALLRRGLSGILEASARYADFDDPLKRQRMEMTHRVYSDVADFIRRHADAAAEMAGKASGAERARLGAIAECCRAIVERPPQSFREALQLFWFVYSIRGFSYYGCGTLGRMDVNLLPFYLHDKEQGVDDEEIIALIMEFYARLNAVWRGDTLRNLTLAGLDAEGNECTSPLTYLFLRAYQRQPDAEPHPNVRVGPNTPTALLDLSFEMIASGLTQPSFYFDDNIIPAMVKAGIHESTARNYAADGCTEIVFDGESALEFRQLETMKSLELALFNGRENPMVKPKRVYKAEANGRRPLTKTKLALGYESGDMAGMASFDDVFAAFRRQYEYQIDCWLAQLEETMEWDKSHRVSSPLLSGTFDAFLETGLDPHRGGGFTAPCYQLLSGSIPTAADGLAGLKYVVFDNGWCTMTEMLHALATNFEGNELLRQRCLSAPKYGNADPYVDEIAAAIADIFVGRVDAFRSRTSGTRVWPGLYNIDFGIFAPIIGATPDGRRLGDAICEHMDPTPGMAKNGPTAILSSAQGLHMERGYASSPLYLSLNAGLFAGGQQPGPVLRSLVAAAKAAGVGVHNISILNTDVLRDAQMHPEKHQDLVVRVWGFNARFVELVPELQEHIIKRINS